MGTSGRLRSTTSSPASSDETAAAGLFPLARRGSDSPSSTIVFALALPSSLVVEVGGGAATHALPSKLEVVVLPEEAGVVVGGGGGLFLLHRVPTTTRRILRQAVAIGAKSRLAETQPSSGELPKFRESKINIFTPKINIFEILDDGRSLL